MPDKIKLCSGVCNELETLNGVATGLNNPISNKTKITRE